MERKSFIRSSIAALAAVNLPPLAKPEVIDESEFISPPVLKNGDVIGITSPAGYITHEEIQSAVKKMESWGYKIKIGDTIDKRDFTFGGTDDERANDLQKMLDDPKIKAIMCARGGYGSVRIIDKLNWEKFKAKPKWIIGFSDATVIHSHLNKNLAVASIHSKMCNSFPDDWSTAEQIQIETIESIQQALSGVKMKYFTDVDAKNKLGTGEGVLIGGNLKTLESLSGTKSDINTAGKILFVEDTGEYMYSVDRMFWNLKRTGKLSQLKGLIIGGFKIKVDEDADDFGRTLQDVVLEKIKAYDYPVCFNFPVGHQRNNYALKCGVKHRLEVKPDIVSLKEI
jgi:muramoyltetrapeptide carboxypeptidase